MRCFLVHFRFRHCHNLEFQFVVSFLFAGGDKPTFKTTAGWCVAHRKGFAWKECRELTPRERNIDFADGVAMATAKKITKLLVISYSFLWYKGELYANGGRFGSKSKFSRP